MSVLVNPFSRSSRAGAAWFCVGPMSAFANVDSTTRVGEQRKCEERFIPGCKVFYVPREDASKAVDIMIDDWKDAEAGDSKDQVMVFQYNHKFFAVNHECPHSSYPLSNGTPFDIEDFGVVLSSGISCPKHDWSFDLHTGRSDRGSYKLPIWEVQQRPGESDNDEMHLWIRRKQKIG